MKVFNSYFTLEVFVICEVLCLCFMAFNCFLSVEKTLYQIRVEQKKMELSIDTKRIDIVAVWIFINFMTTPHENKSLIKLGKTVIVAWTTDWVYNGIQRAYCSIKCLTCLFDHAIAATINNKNDCSVGCVVVVVVLFSSSLHQTFRLIYSVSMWTE